MNRQQLRAYRETGEDPLWNTVWQIWPTAMMFEEATPFDPLLNIRRRLAKQPARGPFGPEGTTR